MLLLHAITVLNAVNLPVVLLNSFPALSLFLSKMM